MSRFTKQWKIAFSHARWWILYIAYELTFSYYISGNVPVTTLFYYVINIGLFYNHAKLLGKYVNVPAPAYFVVVTLVFFEMLIVMLLKFAGDYLFYPQKAYLMHNFHLIRTFIVMDFSRSVFYIGLSTLYWYRGNVAEFRKQSAEAAIRELRMSRDKAELETSLANTQNAYLQQQLNPHLIFNTLNFIYNTVYKTSAEGGRAVLLLSEILGFSLKKTDENGKILLSAEIEQIENLVEINRYRYHYPLDINFNVLGDPGAYRILPLILLTLTENVFKHGEFRNKPASILLEVDGGGLLQFSTVNASRSQLTRQQGKGIGIRNIRLRLDHSYPGKYRLLTNENHDTFRTDLTLQL